MNLCERSKNMKNKSAERNKEKYTERKRRKRKIRVIKSKVTSVLNRLREKNEWMSGAGCEKR